MKITKNLLNLQAIIIIPLFLSLLSLSTFTIASPSNVINFPSEQTVLTSRKPATPPPQYNYENFHQFENTPFKNYSDFENLVIKETLDIKFSDINNLNKEIRPILRKLINENFFKIFRLNLYKQCPFWSDSTGFCMHQSCAVDTIDDWNDLPNIWQPEALGRIESLSKDLNKLNITKKIDFENSSTSKDYCELDEILNDVVYVNLVDNPERFTGYGGDQSFQIWKSIYNENCFNDNIGSNQCFEKTFFYKLVSGMHASISTHLSNEFFNKFTKTYSPSLKQFMFRVGDFPDRIENIYLNYILILKSIVKLDKFGLIENLKLSIDEDEDYDYNNNFEELQLKDGIKNEISDLINPTKKLLSISSTNNNNSNDDDSDNNNSINNHCSSNFLFNEESLFQDSNGSSLKNEFRERFKNITRIMDCVHCDRCRLWGKVQTTGYATALKILFELNDDNCNNEEYINNEFKLTKIELIALLNTFDRLSKSVESIQNFKKLYDVEIEKEENGDGSLTGDHFTSNDNNPHAAFMDTFQQNQNNLHIEEVSTLSATTATPASGDKQSKSIKVSAPPLNKKNQSPKRQTKDTYQNIIETQKINEIKYPEGYNNGLNINLTEAFKQELGNVYEAFKFLVNSYFILPKLVYNWFLIRIIYYWNIFIGTPIEDFDPDRIYRIEL